MFLGHNGAARIRPELELVEPTMTIRNVHGDFALLTPQLKGL
jgi:hypothetical protein